MSVSGGFLWQVVPAWRVGGFSRPAPRFRICGNEVTGPFLDPPVPEETVVSLVEGTISFPGVYGLGAAHQLGPLTVSAEWLESKNAGCREAGRERAFMKAG